MKLIKVLVFSFTFCIFRMTCKSVSDFILNEKVIKNEQIVGGTLPREYFNRILSVALELDGEYSAISELIANDKQPLSTSETPIIDDLSSKNEKDVLKMEASQNTMESGGMVEAESINKTVSNTDEEIKELLELEKLKKKSNSDRLVGINMGSNKSVDNMAVTIIEKHLNNGTTENIIDSFRPFAETARSVGVPVNTHINSLNKFKEGLGVRIGVLDSHTLLELYYFGFDSQRGSKHKNPLNRSYSAILSSLIKKEDLSLLELLMASYSSRPLWREQSSEDGIEFQKENYISENKIQGNVGRKDYDIMAKTSFDMFLPTDVSSESDTYQPAPKSSKRYKKFKLDDMIDINKQKSKIDYEENVLKWLQNK